MNQVPLLNGADEFLAKMFEPLGIGTFPGVNFFTPKPEFLDWFTQNYGDYIIVDAGAGTGHFERRLREKGINDIISIDIVQKDNLEADVIMLNACTLSYPKDSIVTFCRPSHGIWVEIAIKKAFDTGAREVLYIGKECNLERDIGELFTTEKLLSDIGDSGENVWRVIRP